MIKAFDCIVCPMSCYIEVEVNNDEILFVKGNTCPRGDQFVRSELHCPMRMLTTTVKIHNAIHPLLPVISSTNIPKEKIFDIMNICNTLEVQAPVQVGDVLYKNIADTGADILASRTMEMRMLDESKDSTCHQ